MPLKIELKPHESIIIGESLITNDGERTRFYIEGNVPILQFVVAAGEIHLLNHKIDPLAGRVGFFFAENEFFAQEGDCYAP